MAIKITIQSVSGADYFKFKEAPAEFFDSKVKHYELSRNAGSNEDSETILVSARNITNRDYLFSNVPVESIEVDGVTYSTYEELSEVLTPILFKKGGGSGGGGTSILYIETTYSDLKTLRDNGELVVGMQYRITDFVTTTVQTDTQSAGHQFDVIVTADSENTLNENARAIHHEGDTYFDGQNLEGWEIKYSLDNDTDRFAWADNTNGKGVIWYMKDEYNNELYYDFKNIQFKRFLITAVSNSNLSSTFLNTYMGIASTNVFTVSSSDFIWCYTFTWIDTNDDVFDLSIVGNTTLTNDDDKINGVYDNSIGLCNEYTLYLDNTSLYALSNNVFINSAYYNEYFYGLYGNKLGVNSHSNTFGNSTSGNTFGNNTSSNTFGNYTSRNTFGNGTTSNTFGNSTSGNTFGDGSTYNTFGDGSTSNTFGNNTSSNTFGNNTSSNTFGNYTASNTFGNNTSRNTFGNGTTSNTFGNSTSGNTFGNYTYNNTFGDGSTGAYFQYNTIENGLRGGISSSSKKDWTGQTALYGSSKYYSVQVFGYATSSGATTNTYVYYDASGTLVKGTW